MDNLIEFELDLMPWQPDKQSAVDGVPTIDAPNINDSWAGDKQMSGAEYKPWGNKDEKPSINKHSLKNNVTPQIINDLIKPSSRNSSRKESIPQN